MLFDTGSSTHCPVTTLKGMGREMRALLRRQGTYVYLWLIHVDVWQKPTHYKEVIL